MCVNWSDHCESEQERGLTYMAGAALPVDGGYTAP